MEKFCKSKSYIFMELHAENARMLLAFFVCLFEIDVKGFRDFGP